MANATCSWENCERIGVRTGMCKTHDQARRRAADPTYNKYEVECAGCGTRFWSKRKTGKYCSVQCKGSACRTRSKLPADHPVVLLIAEARTCHKVVAAPSIIDQDCAWCGAQFSTSKTMQRFCRFECKRKAMRARRRGREHGSTSHYTWAEVMRIFIQLDRCCAYCGDPVEGQPDPDHVVPLSRGGSDGITNVLPSCRPCNSDKRDLLLSEWAIDRERRGLSPRLTDPRVDPRWVHLTDALLVA